MSEQERPDAPLLRVVRGNPNPEQLAALIGVVSAMGGQQETDAVTTSAWASSARKGRYAPRPAPGAWRLSLRQT